MRILLTGSAGLVGRRLSALLEAAGHEVIGFDVATSAEDGPLLNICDAAPLRDKMAGCDGVIHLAAVSRVAWGEADPELCHCVNFVGTRTVLNTALEQPVPPWFIFASSREVYGDPPEMPITEDAPIAPVNHYGRSKAAGERLVSKARMAGLRTAILRLSNVYGTEHDHPDRAVPSLLWRAMTGADLRITGADIFFDFVHVDDTARAFMRAIQLFEAGAEGLPPVHVTTGIPTSLADLARLAVEITQSWSTLTVLPARAFDVRGFCGKPDRAAQILDWRPEIGLRDGLLKLRAILAERSRAPDPVEMPQVPHAGCLAGLPASDVTELMSG